MDIEPLLAALSDEDPTGEDLEYDPEFGELERAAKRVPEQETGGQIKEAVEPDWKAVRDLSVAVFGRTRDLRAAVHLTKAATHIEGFAGLRDGLLLIQGLSEQFWDTVHPRPDEDDGDCTIRCNAVQDLVSREEDGLLPAVLDAPFIKARMAGQFGLRDLKIISGELSRKADDDRPAPQRSLVEAAFKEVEPEQVQEIADSVAACVAAVSAIQDLFVAQVGAVDAPELSDLAAMLKETDGFLNRQLQHLGLGEAQIDGDADDGVGAGAAAGGAGGATAGLAVSGEVNSREDVVRLLDKVCLYYERFEPSSPVPMLLQRAKGLVHKGFMEIIADLTPGGVSEAKVFGGDESEAESWSPPPESGGEVESSDDSW